MKDKSIKINAILNIVKKGVNIIIPLIVYPYVSRVLGVQAYGKYAFAESVMGYIILISGFGISTYSIREVARVRDDKNKVKQISSEIFTINLITMMTALLILGVMVITIPRIYELRYIFYIMAAEVVFGTLSRDWLNEAYEDYMYITLRYIFFQILSVILILLFVKTPQDVVIYTIIRCGAVVGGYIVSIVYTRKYAAISLSVLKRIKKHWKPLFVFFVCSCASVIYIHSDVTILGFLKSDIDVGTYSFATKIYTMIKSIVNAIVFVMIPRAAYYIGSYKDKLYSELIGNAKNILIIIIIPIMAGIWCLSGDFILVLAGEEYMAGAGALKILALSLFFAVFSYLYAYGCLIPMGMDKYFLKASIASAVFNIIANIIFIPLFGINAAAMTTLAAEIIMYLLTGYYSRKKCNRNKNESIKIISASVIESMMICIEFIFIDRYFSIPIIRILLLFISGTISYLFILGFNTVFLKRRHKF